MDAPLFNQIDSVLQCKLILHVFINQSANHVEQQSIELVHAMHFGPRLPQVALLLLARLPRNPINL